MVQLLQKSVWQLLKKLNTELPFDPAVPLLGLSPKELKAGTLTDIYTPPSQQPCSPWPTGGKLKLPWIITRAKCQWIKRMWCIHTMKYYSALWRREIVTPATPWMSSEDMMLDKTSQTYKDTCRKIPGMQGTWHGRTHGDRK